MTGYPRTEQDIYHHVWINPDVEDSSNEEDEALDGSSNVDKLRDAIDIGDRVKNWKLHLIEPEDGELDDSSDVEKSTDTIEIGNSIG